jgi:hypothetical protein
MASPKLGRLLVFLVCWQALSVVARFLALVVLIFVFVKTYKSPRPAASLKKATFPEE